MIERDSSVMNLANTQWHPFVSWRSIVAGLLVTLFTFATLMFLGMAVGGVALQGIVDQGSSARGFPIGAGIWLLLSTLLSLFAGSYFSGRVSSFLTSRSGAAQGLVIASLFFVLFL